MGLARRPLLALVGPGLGLRVRDMVEIEDKVRIGIKVHFRV